MADCQAKDKPCEAQEKGRCPVRVRGSNGRCLVGNMRNVAFWAVLLVLLMALFGAVILARKQIELGEDERRGLAGMRRFTVDGEAGGTGGAA